jgi:hypothetical protein
MPPGARAMPFMGRPLYCGERPLAAIALPWLSVAVVHTEITAVKRR